MTCYLTDFSGATHRLPVLFSWDILHGLGTPCDAFEICFAYKKDFLQTLSDAVRFRAEHDGETVFTGVVDEFELTASDDGLLVFVRGRGLAALLLDNEAEAAEYWMASLDFMLDRHVYPWGISNVRAGSIPPASSFTVSSGVSHWKVLEEYARFCGGIRPRFSPDGVLILNGEKGRDLTFAASSAVCELRYKERRYGVISRALVNNKAWGISSTVDNSEFLARGGSCRRVINVPRNTSYNTMQHTGEYQIERSQEDSVTLELTIEKLFAAFAGDTIRVSNEVLGLYGSFEVLESRCIASGDTAKTVLKLRKE